MDGLRWTLLIFGLIVVAGVYVYTRYQRNRDSDSPQQDLFADRQEPRLDEPRLEEPRREPVFNVDSDDDHVDDPESEVAVTSPEQKIVTLRVVARNDGAFAGDELILSLRGIGMRHGQFGIFHRHDGTEREGVIFSAASLVEPGSFDMENIADQEIPGVSLFMVLPGPVDGAEAFDLMIAAGRALAQSLNAELLDESGSTLSIQRERYLREEIIQYEHSTGVS